MKQLQNNFTTPEQSRRLLELGVPAGSADMYYFTQDSDIPLYQLGNGVPLYPSWSVGRLIEILRICQKDELGYLSLNLKMLKEKSLVERCIFDLEKTERFDFSKLED